MVLKGQAQGDTITFQAELKPISAMQPTAGLLGATKQISLTAMCFAKDSNSKAGEDVDISQQKLQLHPCCMQLRCFSRRCRDGSARVCKLCLIAFTLAWYGGAQADMANQLQTIG